MTILNIRSTNGSGKTTLALSLLDTFSLREVLIDGIPCTTDKYQKTVLIGPYVDKKTGGTKKIGGCDALSKGFATHRKAITAAALLYKHVVFEGVIVSGTYGSWATFDNERGKDIIWAFLDTPIEECLRRIYARNGGASFKEELVVSKMRGVESARLKALANGHHVLDLHWQEDNATLLKGLLQ